MAKSNVFKNIAKNKYFQLLPDFGQERLAKFTTLVLTLIALSFFGIFAINPTLSTIAKLGKELEDNKFVDQKLTQKINNLNSLQKKYQNLQTDLPVILSSVPKGPEVPLLAAQIQAVAKNSNTSIDNLQTFQVEIPTGPSQKYFSYSFALSASGGYNDLNNFLLNLSNMQRIVSLDILSLTKKSGVNSLQLTLRGRAYFLP